MFKFLLRLDFMALALFGVFVFICIGGVIETYAFIDGVPGVVKPPLYDQLSSLELLLPWVILAAPVHVLGRALNLWWLLKLFPELSPGFKVPLVSIAYSYILAQWTTYSWSRWVRGSRKKVYAVILASLAISAIMESPLTLTSIPVREVIRAITGFVFTLLVIHSYLTSITGIYYSIKELLKQPKH